MKRFLIERSMTTLLLVMMSACIALAQTTISGVVKDETGESLIGVSVQVKGSSVGTATDFDGSFSLDVPQEVGTLVFSSIGFVTQEVGYSGSMSNMMITLSQDANKLDDIVVTGSRGKPRTILGSPVPIDNINAAELRSSGQTTVDQMLNFKVPSYNSSNQAISDATAHFDPSELRNLGPSRTLVLVNGKRKNQSALVYVNDTPGKGEVGTDMKAIPAAAIERVEVLRDGAAAQYGSDAVAGVINIVLKDDAQRGSISAAAGITTQGDGLNFVLDANKGFALGDNGYINLTGSFYTQDATNRAGEPGGDGLFGVIFGDDAILNGTHPWIQANPDLGMTIGQPKYTKLSALANFGTSYGESGEFYGTIGYTRRDGESYALYRAPYWITDDAGLLTPDGEAYNGFQPTFETAVNDYTAILGTRNNIGGWDTDLSVTLGGNDVAYTIGNTINPSLLPNSPTEFDAGAYAFDNIIGNLDISKQFGDATLSLGTELRSESFEVVAGQEESYVNGGAQSFPGLQPSNELDESRNNIGVYAGLDYDVSENTLIGGAVRFENYSDFGSNVSWKLNARQHFADKNGAIRASVSTGFRAPSLHQIYLSNVQTLVSGGTVSNQGTFNNVSPVIKGLGVPALDAETSFNVTAGITYKFTPEFSFSADYYNIAVDNRVLFTGEIGFDGDDANTNPVEQILIDNSVTSIKYFVNALDTRTQGLDLVLNYNSSSWDFVGSLNLNETTIENDEISSPGVVGEVGYDIFNRKEQSRVTSARPKTKALVGITYKMDNGLRVSLNNTYFGEVTWQHASDPGKDQTFAGKVITDLIVGYKVNEDMGLNLTVNNLFNVYPDVIDTKGDFVTDLGGRFKYPWEVNQFGFMGTIVKAGFNYNF